MTSKGSEKEEEMRKLDELLPRREPPRKEELDDIVPDRPVFPVNRDMHRAWLNSLALQDAGITQDTPDPWDGRIDRSSNRGAKRIAPRRGSVFLRAPLAAGPAGGARRPSWRRKDIYTPSESRAAVHACIETIGDLQRR